MNLIILLAVAGLSNSAKLDNAYLPPSHALTSGGSENFLQTPSQSNDYHRSMNQPNQFSQTGYNPQGNSYAGNIAQGNDNAGYGQNSPYNQAPERAQASFERNAKILRQDFQNDGENYSYGFETENGISAEQQGVATWQNGVEAQGGFSYTGDDGQVYTVRYTADKNGFVPYGDHLPTPPPIPMEILRALEKNAQDEAAGIFDDGSYNKEKYSSHDDHNQSPNGNSGYNYNAGNGNNQNHQSAIELLDDDTVVTNNALQRDGGNFGNKGNQANTGVTQAYLPPFGQSKSQASSPSNQGPYRNQKSAFGNQGNQSPSYGNQGPSSYNQGSSFGSPQSPGFSTQGQVNKAYLPPFERQRSSDNQRPFNQAPGFKNQGSEAANKGYLPPHLK